MENKDYTIQELQPGLFAIDDAKGDSMYLIIGGEKALLIDTCMMEGDILPMLKTLTEKPVELALTHAHIDHMYHAGEFQTVYLHRRDIAAWRKGLLRLMIAFGFSMFHMPRKRYRVRRYIPLDENSVIDLGGNRIHVISAPGHTPGSCIFVDDVHRALFVGDAIGNGGASAWMWLPGSAKTSAYRQTLRSLLTRLAPYETYAFLGGHRANTLPTEEQPEGLPLNLQVVRDMDALCTMMLNHTVQPSGRQKFFLLTAKQYAFGTAGMWTLKSKIR